MSNNNKKSENSKIGSTRTIEINNSTKAKSSLPFLDNDVLSKQAQLRLVLTNENSNLLQSWEDELFSNSKFEHYTLVKSNPPFYDQCYVKLRLEYSKEQKHNIDKVNTAIIVGKNKHNNLNLEKLDELLKKYNKWRVTIKASCTYTWKDKKGINYMVDKIELF